MTPDEFAQTEYTEFVVYTELAKREKNPEIKIILEQLAEQELGHYEFWKTLSNKKDFHVSGVKVLWHRVLRNILGATFFVKNLERSEKKAILEYEKFLANTKDETIKVNVRNIIEDEKTHERAIINAIKEERVDFTGSIVLGLNDGLIELTGALMGFVAAFNSNQVVLAAGFITGVSASLSMAASSYMSEKHDSRKNPKKSAAYTGISYMIVVALLLFPFVLPLLTIYSLMLSITIVIIIVAGVAYYTSVLFDWSFIKQFREMLVFSLGVAFVAYLLGTMFRGVTGIVV